MLIAKNIPPKFGLSDEVVRLEDGRIAVFHIRFPDSVKAYGYLSEDLNIQKNDLVLVFTNRSENSPEIGTVDAITYCLPTEMPYPLEKTRHIYAKFTGTMPQEFLTSEGIAVNNKGVAVRSDHEEIGAHITFPPETRKIGEYLFDHIAALQTVMIPEGVKKIGAGAFEQAIYLVAVSIPASVTDIAHNAFSGCFGVKSWSISPLNQNYKIIGPYIFADHETTLFRAAERLEGEATLPEGIRRINTAAFDYCKITKVFVPEGVEEIGDGAFQLCNELIEVSLPESLKAIGNFAFSDCSKLQSITIPASVKKIGHLTFWHCPNLREVIIRSSSISLNRSLFAPHNPDEFSATQIPLIAPHLKIDRIPPTLMLNAILGFREMRKRQINMAQGIEKEYINYIHAQGKHWEDAALQFPALKQLLIEEGILPSDF